MYYNCTVSVVASSCFDWCQLRWRKTTDDDATAPLAYRLTLGVTLVDALFIVRLYDAIGLLFFFSPIDAATDNNNEREREKGLNDHRKNLLLLLLIRRNVHRAFQPITHLHTGRRQLVEYVRYIMLYTPRGPRGMLLRIYPKHFSYATETLSLSLSIGLLCVNHSDLTSYQVLQKRKTLS